MTVEPALATITPPSTPPRIRVGALAAILVAITILAAAFVWGVQLHEATWTTTEPIRFVGDITNAYGQGQRSADTGLFRVYDTVAISAKKRADGVREYGLDYPPLRLAAAHYWYLWTREHFPDVSAWQNTRAFNQPFLILNQCILGIAAIGAFGLVHLARRWRAGHRLGGEPGISTGLIAAAIAAAIVWLSPPAMLVGFGWPQWDIAVPAFFLVALFAASRNAWAIAGALLAAGAMYKGQVLAGLPVFIIWPIVAGRWTALPRLAIGFMFVAGLIAAPFAMRSGTAAVRPEVIWFALAMLLPWLLGLAGKVLPQLRAIWWSVPVLLGTAVCAIAGLVAAWYPGAIIAAVLALLLYFAGRRIPFRHQLTLPALAIAAAIWTSALASGASWNWLLVGFLYGTEHFPALTMGSPSNFAALLPQFRINRPNVVAFALPDWLWSAAAGYEVTWGALLRAIYLVGSVLCGIAAGVHFRRRNPLFLMAAVTPWLLFVTFPAQIHERYILYPALASAVFVALGFGWTFMHLAISLIAVLPVLHGMLRGGQPAQFMVEQVGPEFGTQLLRNVQATHPGIAWALVTITLVCLWKSMDLRGPRGAASATPAITKP